MDPITHLPSRATLDPLDRELAEIDAAIGLVVAGAATRVRLVGLVRPESLAAVGLARSQAAAVRFEIDRGAGGAMTLTLGPRAPRAG